MPSDHSVALRAGYRSRCVAMQTDAGVTPRCRLLANLGWMLLRGKPAVVVVAAWLRELLAGREVACVPKGNDRYGRVLAMCFLGGENLNDRIVREGWALDFRRYTSAYLDAEEEAKRRKVGLWEDFEPPWE